MPFAIKKTKKGYQVIKKTTGKAIPGYSKSRKMAQKRIAAINKSEGHW